MIELLDVKKVYRTPQGSDVVAVDALTLRIERGETVALIGTSGCGKTTTLNLINRLIEPTSGCVRIDGTDAANWDVIRLRRRIGYVLQTGGLFPHMTVAKNVGLLCELEGWDRKKVDERSGELLDLVNLPPGEFARRYPHELSGGQRQRVGVARALALDPPRILMDEPFGALDPITRDQLQDEFLQLKQRVNKTIVLVTHNMREAFKLAERVALMDGGKIVQVGTADSFRQQPASPFVEEFLRSHLDGESPGSSDRPERAPS